MSLVKSDMLVGKCHLLYVIGVTCQKSNVTSNVICRMSAVKRQMSLVK